MDYKRIQKSLLDFSEKHGLIERAKKSCKNVIKNIVEENNGDLSRIGGFDINELIFEFNSQILIFKSYTTDVPFIRTQIGIYIKDLNEVWIRNIEPIGSYELDTSFEGEDIDDWLNIDKTKKFKKE